jgi:hypothetical protein
MPQNPSQPAIGHARCPSDQVEFTMPERDAVPGAEVLELLLGAVAGVFPGPVLEALIARLEGAK